uniref:Uncharacterized protein n=1 Tax=Anguilla anguilla TaxID=7936 RepID=A0A0E9PQZ1_ANGAN
MIFALSLQVYIPPNSSVLLLKWDSTFESFLVHSLVHLQVFN